VLDGSRSGGVGNSFPLANLIDTRLHTEDTVDTLHRCRQRSRIVVIALDDKSACLPQRLCRRLVGVTGECPNTPAFAQQMTGGCAALPTGCSQD